MASSKVPRLVEMCDLRLGAFHGSFDFEYRTQTGLEENGSGIPRKCKSTPDEDVSNRRCKHRRFCFLLESNDGIYMILRSPIVYV